MSLSDIALQVATLIAAIFQSATGIGFGMIAGPVVLVVLADPSAVMISTAMSWLIALVLWPMLWRDTDRAMLVRLTGGAALGLPVGLGLLAAADVEALKLGAGLVILALTAMMILGVPGIARPGRGPDLVYGALAGVFGAALAMPGPTAALRMTARGYPKRVVRATMVSFFCTVWPVILAGQALTRGIEGATARQALALVPATLGGLALGHWLAGRVSERVFRLLVRVFLLATAAGLLAASSWHYIGRG